MTPDFRVTVDDQDITETLRGRVSRLTVEDQAGERSDSCEIVIADPNDQVALPRHGAVLQVWLGWSGRGLVNLGKFTVDEVEVSGPPSRITIAASAANMRREMKEKKTRSWPDASLGKIAATIAAEHGLSAVVSVELSHVTYAHIDQTNESDLNFLTRLARDNDATAKPTGGRLVLAKRAVGRSSSGKRLTPVSLAKRELTSWSGTIADRPRHGAAVATWHDVNLGERLEVKVGSDSPVKKLAGTFASHEEAKAAAQAAFDRSQRMRRTLKLNLAEGRPEIVAETPVELSDLRSGLNGTWVAKRVAHKLTKQTFTTDLSAEWPK